MDSIGDSRTRDQGRPEGDRRLAIYRRDGCRCAYCQRHVHVGAETSDPLCATLDHVVCFADGGSWSPDNVVTCCMECNRRRGRKLLAQWIRKLAAERHPGDRRAIRAEISRISARIRAALRRPVEA